MCLETFMEFPSSHRHFDCQITITSSQTMAPRKKSCFCKQISNMVVKSIFSSVWLIQLYARISC